MRRCRYRDLMANILKSTSGSVLVEFALVFPILLTMYLGSVTLSDAIACKRKVTIATRAVTDLTSRYSVISSDEMTKILNASTQVLAPYNASNAAIVITEVKVTDSTHARVIWSRARNGTPLTASSTITIPDGISPVNSYLLAGTIRYQYRPSVNFGFLNTITFTETILISPRLADQITLT
jgi:Flp pilus assembly protein TadG